MRRFLGALGATAVLLAGCGDDDAATSDARTGAVESPSEVLGDPDEGIEGVRSVRVFYENPVHATGDIDYGLTPPAGGLHNPVAAPCGFYAEAVPDENVGHTLEHGAVWISYAPDLPSGEVEAIRELAAQNAKVLASPYEGLPADEPVVATAWARQLRLDSASDPRLAQFVNQYQDSTNAPEAGVGC